MRLKSVVLYTVVSLEGIYTVLYSLWGGRSLYKTYQSSHITKVKVDLVLKTFLGLKFHEKLYVPEELGVLSSKLNLSKK